MRELFINNKEVFLAGILFILWVLYRTYKFQKIEGPKYEGTVYINFKNYKFIKCKPLDECLYNTWELYELTSEEFVCCLVERGDSYYMHHPTPEGDKIIHNYKHDVSFCTL